MFYKHLIGLTITLDLLALKRVNNNRDIFEVSSPIKIQITPHPGLGQSLTLTGYNSVLT